MLRRDPIFMLLTETFLFSKYFTFNLSCIRKLHIQRNNASENIHTELPIGCWSCSFFFQLLLPLVFCFKKPRYGFRSLPLDRPLSGFRSTQIQLANVC